MFNLNEKHCQKIENNLLKSDFFGSVQKALNPLLKNQQIIWKEFDSTVHCE